MRRFQPARRPKSAAVGAVVLWATAGVLGGCSSGSHHAAAVPSTSPSSSSPLPAGGPPSSTDTPGATIPANLLADPGLPSQVSQGPLDQNTVSRMMQYFEDQVAAAYASGDASQLDHYVAGPMLTGNAGTINFLNTQNKRNVFRITVDAVSIDTNGADRVTFDMAGQMTVDYFVGTTDGQVLDGGLPGPSALNFLCFFDYNPQNHTWYWTGEQDESSNMAGSASDGLSTGGG